MKPEINCKQFIYSKYTGVKGASYQTVAGSDGIEKSRVISIRKIFDGCRPSSTSIETFQQSFITSTISNNEIALLHLTRSREKEYGRSYFLQEHYVILEKEDLRKTGTKSWFWLHSLPDLGPIYKYENLSNVLSLSQIRVNSQFESAVKNLSNDSDPLFQASVISSVYYLLYSKSVSFVSSDRAFDIWVWLTAVNILLPTLFSACLRLFVGDEVPRGWNSDLSVSFNSDSVLPANSRVINPFLEPKTLLSLKDLTQATQALADVASKDAIKNFSWSWLILQKMLRV